MPAGGRVHNLDGNADTRLRLGQARAVSIDDVARALASTRSPNTRAALQRLALKMFELELLRWRCAVLQAALCRLGVDTTPGGGDDDGCEGAAA